MSVNFEYENFEKKWKLKEENYLIMNENIFKKLTGEGIEMKKNI